MDTTRIPELKKQLDNIVVDLSRAMDLGFATKSEGQSVYEGKLREQLLLSGSSIYNMYHKIQETTKGTDYDFYFVNDTAKRSFEIMIGKGGFATTQRDYGVEIPKNSQNIYVGGRAYVMNYAPLFPSLNFIFYDQTAEYENLYSEYTTKTDYPFIQHHDFMHTCAVYNFHSEELYIPHDTLVAIGDKKLIINPRWMQMIVHDILILEDAERKVKSDADKMEGMLFNPSNLIRAHRRFEKFVTRGMDPDHATATVYRRLESVLQN